MRGEEPVLTHCVEIHALSREVAARGVPVRVRGVVSFSFPGTRTGFIVDDGHGVFVGWGDALAMLAQPVETFGIERLEPGTVVEIRGVTARGRFAPIIVPQEIKVVGNAPLPPFPPTTISAIRGGNMDCQGVELSGVVRRTGASQEMRRAAKDMTAPRFVEDMLEVVAPDGRFGAVLRWKNPKVLEQYVDAEVRLRGVVLTYFNTRGECMGVRLQVTSEDSLEVIHAAPRDPFEAPQTTTRRLAPFSMAPVNLHQQRLSGTVTLCRPGEFFYLEDEGRSVRVSTSKPESLRPGQRVEVAGFVELTRYFAEVRDAVFRPLGTALVPEPIPATVEQLVADVPKDAVSASDDFDGRLVRLPGLLLKVDAGRDGDFRLLLDCAGSTVVGLLGRDTPPGVLARFQPGSQVEVTGIVVLNLVNLFGGTWPATLAADTRDLHLLLRDAADLRILRTPSWWTPERLWRALAILGVVLLAALAWVTLLRRRVAERSSQLAAEMQARSAKEIAFAATQRERTRLAADLHDTLEQALTGLAFQLDATRRFSPPLGERGTHHLELSRQLLASSREDLRRSIWNLRARVLEGRSFIEALRASAERSVAGREIAITVEETGNRGALTEFVAGHLLLLAQEAMTNALKHASPRRIAVRVVHEDQRVSLVIEDDGSGFDTERAAGMDAGHFGLQGMRERADRLDGVLIIESTPGKGARITATVPVTEAVEALAADEHS